MNRILAIVMALGLVSVTMPGYAETITAPDITVSADVASAFTISVDLRDDDLGAGYPDITPDTAMDFGTLVEENGILVTQDPVVAFINVVNTDRTAYTINSSITDTLTDGANEIPDGAFVVNVNKTVGADPGTIPYASGTAVGDHTIYASGGTNPTVQVEAHYTISGDPSLGATEFVPLDQPAGSYATTLQLSATRA